MVPGTHCQVRWRVLNSYRPFRNALPATEGSRWETLGKEPPPAEDRQLGVGQAEDPRAPNQIAEVTLSPKALIRPIPR